MMNYGLNSGPTSSLRHINEINHKRGLTHLKSYKTISILKQNKDIRNGDLVTCHLAFALHSVL